MAVVIKLNPTYNARKRHKSKGDNISRIKFWHSRLTNFFKRTAFILQYYSKKILYRLKLYIPHIKTFHINTFPAVHLKKMDWYDYAFKFSSELLVLVIALTVAGLNVAFFGLTGGRMTADNSHAAKFLSYHSELNPGLYAQETSINTVIITPQGFISQASAETLPTLQDNGGAGASASSPADNSGEVVLNDDGMVKPNPDSIGGLISKQIKIYTTVSGDTLASVAAKFGISQQTILWANNMLNGTVLKPGWQLVILPVDGVLYTANSNDTIPDIAKKFSSTVDTIVSYNGLDSPEDISAGQVFIIPGGIMPAPSPAKPTPPPVKPKTNSGSAGSSGSGSIAGNEPAPPQEEIDTGAGHSFPWGYCTWYVATKVHVPWGGNAKAWLANAKAYGSVISMTPTVGAIVVTNDSRKYGHVAYVESVDDGGFTVSEMNYEHFGKVDYRYIPNSSHNVKGFIYP